MKIAHKLTLVVMALGMMAPMAWGTGTWVDESLPSAVSLTHGLKIQDCESDSKGNIWYSVTEGGLYSQSADGTTWNSYPGVLVHDTSGYMGVYVDKTTDSVWAGDGRGHVMAGKNGVFNALPTIPLDTAIVSRSRIRDLFKDANGYLTALTDSLAWWFDGTQWHVIGDISSYGGGSYYTLGNYLPNGDFASQYDIFHANRTVTPIPLNGMGFSVGGTGTLYAGAGGLNERLYISPPLYNG